MKQVVLMSAMVLSNVAAGQSVRTLLVTGQNNHNWRYTSRVHAETLEATGRFAVTITDSPETDLARPDALKGIDLVVLDYNAEPRWPAAAEANFANAVRAGTGVVAIHAANNAFPGWNDYEAMLGLLWRKGETGHGKFHTFAVELVDAEHPITKGLSGFETPDELYHKMVNPQKAPYHLLARAMSSTESGGTGKYEPMALTVQFGKGRVFATPLGHVWVGSDESKSSIVSPGFRALLVRGAEWAATGAVTLPTAWTPRAVDQNMLTPEEEQHGWRLLFDGSTTTGWHGWKQPKFPDKGWSVQGGTLCFTPGQGGGDIATDGEFADFELSFDWKVAEGGNSGVMYRCTEDKTYPWETGREYQILDDRRHNDGKGKLTRAACVYAVAPLAFDVARPAGEWNHGRIVCRGSRIEHHLNGFKVVDLDTTSPEYAAAVEASKFKSMPDYGKRDKGRIALQDHGDPVWYRNIKIRELK
ncbi:MAG: hypothetical protein HBSAPP03_18870 [Phycisphaerae bacterium]|nr:MAG: hypothetical protein HBSAPP03_18870 [Phycisphaerae bacterium]